MKTFKSLLVLGAMAMASSMAWGQTVVAHMQDLVDGATVTTATVSTDWETDAAGGAVYKFTRTSQDVGTYLGGIDNEAVKNAFYGSKVVTVAAWVYGRPNGCIFGLGEQNTGIKFLLSTSGSSTTFKTTTKGKADFTAQSITLTNGAWNLVAFSVYGKASGTSSYRYYAGDSGNNYYTMSGNNLSNMADASLCGIGSGNQNGPREVFSSELANLTVIESDGYLDNATIAGLVGAAPTKVGPETYDPNTDAFYYLKVKDQELYVNLIDNSTDRKKDVILGTTAEPLKFASVAGGYTIQNENGLYVGKYTNDWNMSSANAETWTVEKAEEGYYYLHCDKGYLGVDEYIVDKAFYRNKTIGSGATIFELVPGPAHTNAEVTALQAKINLAMATGASVGYPKADAAERYALNVYDSYVNDGVTAENYEAAQAALNNFYNCTNVVLPEADKYYEIKATYHNDTWQYLGFDGTKLSITDAKPMGGSVTFKAESVEGNNVVLSIDGHYVHWTSGDDKGKTADTDGLNEELDANLNTLVLSKATSGNTTPKATTENLFGLLQIQGKSSGTSNKNNLFYFVTRNDLVGVGNFIAGNAGDKFFDDNWDHLGHNRTTYFSIVEVEAPAVDVPATAAEIESAADLLWRATAGFIGYPKADDPVVAALDAAVNKAGVTATELGAAVLAYKNCENVVLPEKNQFYQLQGSSTLTVIGGGTTGNAVKLDAETFSQAPQEVDLSSIYFYSEEGYLINYNGGRALKGSAVAGVSETPDVYTFCHEALTEPGTLSIKNAAGKYLIDVHHNLNTTDAPVGAATNWNVNAYGYAPIAVGSTGYATAYLPYNLVSAPYYGIEAVYVVYEDGGVLQAEEIDCIPARVPVIVKTNGEQRCFGKGMGGSESWEPSDEVKASLAKNVLSGSLLAIAKPANALVLGYEDEQIGFYGFSGSVLAGFKAYYEPAAASNGLRINFDGTLTAIESAVESAQGHQIFDLQGRRVNGAAHGLFIQNGKKVVK